jgi:hypothetical protein
LFDGDFKIRSQYRGGVQNQEVRGAKSCGQDLILWKLPFKLLSLAQIVVSKFTGAQGLLLVTSHSSQQPCWVLFREAVVV